MFHSILVPLDISESRLTEQVVPYVQVNAAINNAKVHFLTVIRCDFLQMIAQGGIRFEHFKDFQRSGDNRRSQRIGEQIRPAALTKQIDDFLTGSGKASRSSAQGLA